MKRTLLLPDIKPMSVNAMYFRSFNGVSKTAKASDWTYEVFFALSSAENLLAMQDLRNHFDPNKHVLSFSITAAYSKEDLYTKKGQISARTQDCTNFEKSIVDCICLPKYYDQVAPQGCQNLNIDDRYITEVHSFKALSTSGRSALIVDIEIRDLSVVPQITLD